MRRWPRQRLSQQIERRPGFFEECHIGRYLAPISGHDDDFRFRELLAGKPCQLKSRFHAAELDIGYEQLQLQAGPSNDELGGLCVLASDDLHVVVLEQLAYLLALKIIVLYDDGDWFDRVCHNSKPTFMNIKPVNIGLVLPKFIDRGRNDFARRFLGGAMSGKEAADTV